MNAHTTMKRFRTAALAAVAVLSGTALLVGGTATAGAQEIEDETPHITVVVTPDEVQGDCVPAGLGLSYVVFSDDSVFRLTVTAASPQCTPIDASAVIYGMPGNGEAWPQQLLEREPVRISAAGVYEITFLKDCDPGAVRRRHRRDAADDHPGWRVPRPDAVPVRHRDGRAVLG